jgi:hypothetical protein
MPCCAVSAKLIMKYATKMESVLILALCRVLLSSRGSKEGRAAPQRDPSQPY